MILLINGLIIHCFGLRSYPIKGIGLMTRLYGSSCALRDYLVGLSCTSNYVESRRVSYSVYETKVNILVGLLQYFLLVVWTLLVTAPMSASLRTFLE